MLTDDFMCVARRMFGLFVLSEELSGRGKKLEKNIRD
jgi:hypothetical protein